MKHYSHHTKQQMKSDLNVEFGQEFGLGQGLDHESHHALLAAKEGGMITKRLADSAKNMHSNHSKVKK